ncbi:MAG: PAS domain-containing protein, partial [Armatimonadota bacterium]
MAHRSAEDRYRALFNVIPQGVIVYDTAGVMIEANEAAAEIIGADLDQIIGHNTRETDWPAWTEDGETLAWEDRPPAVTLRTGEPVRDFVFGVNRICDGEPRWILASTEPIFDESGEVVAAVASVTDITEERAEQQQLQESREQLQAIVDASPPAIITVNMEGIVTSWSPSAERIFGWSAEEVIGEFNPTVSEDIRDFYADAIREWDHRGSGDSEEIAVLCRDGSTVEIAISVAPLHEDGEQVGVVGIMEDISDRKRAEEREREQREHLATIMRSSPSAIVTVDMNGNVV